MVRCNNCRERPEMELIEDWRNQGDLVVYRCPMCQNIVPVEEVHTMEDKNICPVCNMLVTQCDCGSHPL